MLSRHPLAQAIGLGLFAVVASTPALGQSPERPDAERAVELDTFVVRPLHESQERAIEDKRAADAIQDGVASDTMGQYPDQNVAESLQRLPGVSVTRDQGEGRFVVIRGLDAALNSVSIDGIAVGTPEDSVRAAPLDVIPSDSTERLTVIKAPTPDMPGDSIGGTIKVESASAFDRDGRSVRAKLEGSHSQLSGDTNPKAAFNFSDVFAGGTFGVAFGLNYQDRDYESDNVEIEYDEHEDLPDGQLVPIEVQQRKYFINRERYGANLNLDWRPDEDNRYHLRTLYSDFTDAETRQRSIIPLGEGSIEDLGGGQYLIEGLDPGDFSRRVRWRTKAEDTFAASFGGENRLGFGAIDYLVGYTRTKERVNDEVEARFDYDGDDDLSARLDTTRNLPRYVVDDPSGDGWLRNANYAFDRFVVAPTRVNDEEKSAAINLRVDGDVTTWKIGLLGRWRDRDADIDEAELRRGPDISLGDWTSAGPDYRFGSMGDGIGSRFMRRYLRDHLGEYSARPQDVAANTEVSLVEDYTASEDIVAAYAMGSFTFDALRIIAGVRAERTDFSATGNVVDLEDEETIGSISRRHADNRYTNLLPGLHLRYDLGEDWVLRGAWTNTISRPSFGDASPRTKINRDEEEVQLGNPLLDPYESSNLDLSIEHYFGTSGIISLGLFHKSIDGYIVETITRNDAAYPGFEVTLPINGDTARVHGLEINWQQQLDFLPGDLDGFLFGLSGTWLDTRFKVDIEDRDDNRFDLPRASDRIISAYLGYEKGGLSTRVAAVHRSEYLDTIGDSADYDLYVAPNTQLDFSLSYRFSPNWSTYLEASNLLDEPLELYQGNRSRTLQREEYGRTYALGVKLAF